MMPKRQPHHIPLLVTLAVGAPVAVLIVWPQAVGAQLAPVVAQVLAFRGPVAIALLVLACVAALVAVLRRRWGVAAGIALVLAATSVGSGTVLLARGSGDTVPGGDLVIVAWNTLGGAASPESIAELVVETDADVVSLPETGAAAAAEVARIVALAGREMRAGTTYGESGDSPLPTSVLIAADLGEYRVDPAAGSSPGVPSGVWRPVDGSGPVIVAAHPMPPLPDEMDRWRAGLAWVAEQCDGPDVIVAGDLNATVDHLSAYGREGLIGDCRDAADEAGAAATGTWPTSVPAWLAAPIDHVLVGSAWTVHDVTVVTSFDDRGSDHRPIVAVIGR
ncbi:hypothetical protein GCM10010460_18350 [Microbacterium terrae]|uniref:Endonuclease/Exonuclease/phosphatase family protein n=2 Tax=Microbacterium terrae TaxID=69369 RepID=A0A0M2HG88_9MICO|nr:Endonuclease/Exonuclease/phosphatase family protein [Microbacterium terrae]GLJ97892.1 hypothetical protein GCM10017594_10890 [Microbacterium terrae]